MRYYLGDVDGTMGGGLSWSAEPFSSAPVAVPVPSANLVADFDVLAGVTLGTGNQVEGWADQSINSNDLTSAGTGRPAFTNNLTPSGYPAIAFNGDTYMSVDTPTGIPFGGAVRTMFSVVRYRSGGWGGVAYGTNSTRETFGLAVSSSGQFAFQVWGDDEISSVDAVPAGWVVQAGRYDAANIGRLFIDGTSIANKNYSANPLNTATTRLAVGAEIDLSPLIQMDVARILLYDAAMTDPEITALSNTLQSAYLT